MKATLQLTFKTYERFKEVRDFVEKAEGVNWKYGAMNGKHFIQFFNGTSNIFYLDLGAFLAGEDDTLIS